MELSIFVAQILAIMYVAIGLGVLFGPTYYHKMYQDMLKNTPAIYLGGFMALIIGFLLVKYHNIWEYSWIVIITILGWLALIKGVLLFVAPKPFVNIFKSWFKTKTAFTWMGFIALVIGFVLGYFGFIA